MQPETAMEAAHTGGWMADLPVTRTVALLTPRSPWSPSERPEVTVRGALGKALHEVLCVFPRERQARGSCSPCPERERCAIPTWFEGHGQEARPYAIRVDPHGPVRPDRPLRVNIVWFGPMPRPAAVQESLSRLATGGLGQRRVPHVLSRLWVRGEGGPIVVVHDDSTVGAWPRPGTLADQVRWPPARVAGASVAFRTPFQQKRPGRPSPQDILKAAILRVRSVARACGVELHRRWPEPIPGEWEALEHHVAARRSSSGQGRHDLSGWTGVVRFDERIAPFADLLAAAEVLHVGRGSSAGLGRVDVDWS